MRSRLHRLHCADFCVGEGKLANQHWGSHAHAASASYKVWAVIVAAAKAAFTEELQYVSEDWLV